MMWLFGIIAFLIAYVLKLKFNIWELEDAVLKSGHKEKVEYKTSDHWRYAYENQHRINQVAHGRNETLSKELARAYEKLSDARRENEILREEIQMCCEKKNEQCERDAFILLDQLEKEFERVTNELERTKEMLNCLYSFNFMRNNEELKLRNSFLQQENTKMRDKCIQLQLNLDDLKTKFNKLSDNYHESLKVNMELQRALDAERISHPYPFRKIPTY